MKHSILLLIYLFSLSLFSCSNNISSEPVMQYQATSIGTLREYYKYLLNRTDLIDASYYFLKKHKDEVLKNLEVVEEVEVEKDVYLVFYKYSIGTDIAKKTEYFRKLDGKYLPYSVFYSSYDDDPFKNGKAGEAKALLKKAEEWDENTIWWDR